jgi:hypothetical protein
MAKYKRKNPESVADRLRWLAPHAEGFTAQLGQSGYSAATITEAAGDRRRTRRAGAHRRMAAE